MHWDNSDWIASIIWNNFFTATSNRSLLHIFISKKRVKPFVAWYYGPTGSGKATKAETYSKEEDTFFKDNTKWWDEYDNQETVIIDDYRAKNIQFDSLLRLLDFRPYICEIKGGHRWFNSKNIIITTTKSPQETFRHLDEDIQQLLRRINIIEEMDQSQILDQDQELGNTVPTPYLASLPMQ